MSNSNQNKSGFELDTVDLPSIPVQSKKTEPDAAQPQAQTTVEQTTTEKKTDPKQTVSSPVSQPQLEEEETNSIRFLIWLIPMLLILLGVAAFFLFGETRSLPLSENKAIPARINQAITAYADRVEIMQSQLRLMDTLSNRINSKQKIATILESLAELESTFAQYTAYRNKLIQSLSEFREPLEQEGNHTLLSVLLFYTNKGDEDFLAALSNLIETQKKYLNYFFNNYEKIIRKQQPQFYTYEKYYLEYTRVTENYEQETLTMNSAIRPILQKYPNSSGLFLIRKGTAIFKID